MGVGARAKARKAGIWKGLTPRQRDFIRQNEAEEVDDIKLEEEQEIAQALAAVFGVTAEEIRQALQEGNFVLPQGDIPDANAKILLAEEILDEQALKRRIRSVFAGDLADEVIEVLGQPYTTSAEGVARTGFDVALDQMDAEGAFNAADPRVQSTMSRLNQQAVGMTDATRRRINKIVRMGADDPEQTVQDVADRVVRDVDEMGALPQDPDRQSRAQRIAATSVQSSFNSGQLHAMEQIGAVGKKWISMRDFRTRSGHLAADSRGETRRIEQPFMVAPKVGRQKEQIMFPGDPSGSASNIINCRCSMTPIIDEGTFQEEKESSPDLGNLPQLAAS